MAPAKIPEKLPGPRVEAAERGKARKPALDHPGPWPVRCYSLPLREDFPVDASFFPTTEDSHGAARHVLDELLSNGTGRIMVACAFCSGAGVAIMYRHLPRLQTQGSCLVVSADSPTEIDAVNDLAAQAPGAVWVHQTGKLPNEKRVGHALMHSKVFYAEAGDKCWLWVGSHNLTGRAMTGANLEAAVLMTGHPAEPQFQAARQHIEACRAESSPCPVEIPPSPDGQNVDVVVIHAEADELPSARPPWHVRLGLRSAEYDWSLIAPADLRLHLYRPGDLAGGWQHAVPWGSFGGTLTGLNFTDIHPEYDGMAGAWESGDYSITDTRSVLLFSIKPADRSGIVTQAVIHIANPAPSDEAFLPRKPKAESEDETERHVVGSTDEDIARFFTRQSIQNGQLVYEVRHRGKASWKMSIGDLREPDRQKLLEEADERQVELLDVLDEKRARHPLIMRAKYRLR